MRPCQYITYIYTNADTLDTSDESPVLESINTKRRSLLDAGIGRGMARGAGTNYILNELTRLVLLRFSENGKKKYV